jgi:hypothetical protein
LTNKSTLTGSRLKRRGGNGEAQVDVLGPTITRVRFPGSYAVQSQALAAAVVDDLLEGGDLSFSMALTNPSGA